MPPQENPAQDRADAAGWLAPARGWIALAVALVPAVLAVWITPTFVTQDGPAHLYNARVLVESLRADSPYRDVFRVQWSPLPNWSGHLLGMGLIAGLPPRGADRMMTTIPLVGLAAATFTLRRRVAGRRGEGMAAAYSALVGLNVAWLFGFTSFVLGGCLFAVTLGAWWSSRDRAGIGPGLVIAAWVVLGYFTHVVSLGLTAVGLVVLAVAAPGAWRARLKTLAIGLSPLVVLAPMYRAAMSRGGPMGPSWGHIGSVRQQFGWVDPISLGKKGVVPFLPGQSAWLGFASPVGLMAAAAAILVVATIRRPDRSRRGWGILAAILLLGGAVTPDTLGPSHGNYLPQRVVLLGLVALAPALDFDASRRSGKVALGLILAALAGQSLAVWDYARECHARAGPIARCAGSIGEADRVATLLVGISGPYRSNPVLHADNLLGLGAGSARVVWADYETTHYYFPVQLRDDRPHPPADQFEEVAKMDSPPDSAERARLWANLLDAHHGEIDVLLVWGRDAGLDRINARYFADEPYREDGPVRLYRHR